MENIKIKSNNKVSEEYYLLELDGSSLINNTKPGQFFNIRLSRDEGYDPLLRRPLSIHDINEKRKSIYILYRIIGRGTRILSKFQSGETIDVLGPLGTGFNTDFNEQDILIIGGGMGIAPLYYLSKKLVHNNKLTVILGGNNKEDLIYFSKAFSNINTDIKYTTIDGSLGHMGNAIDLWEKISEFSFDYIYTCGPLPMLIRVQELARKYNIKGQVSMEERMGCGIGLCLSCVCHSKEGNQRVCMEGPVFTLNKIDFENKLSGCDCNE